MMFEYKAQQKCTEQCNADSNQKHLGRVQDCGYHTATVFKGEPEYAHLIV
ncbi:MAG: hypothetical protein RI932_2155 [Pseudomonadota bacterium]|jgi:hypothetical protein